MKNDHNSQNIPGVKHVQISKLLYVLVTGFATIRPTREYLSSLFPLRQNETFGPYLDFLIFNENLARENMVNNPESTEQLVLIVFPLPLKLTSRIV